MMMMTAKENPTGSSASASSQSNGRSNEIPMNIHPSISSTFDYRQHPSWHKPMTYANYPISTPLFVNPSSTGASSSSSSVDLSTKSFYPHPSMIHPHFYRRHTESTLSTPLYPTATTPFNYPPPSTFYYGWNSHPSTSLIRTHSASFQDYSPYLVNFNSTTTNQDKTMTTGSRLLTVGSHSMPPPPPPPPASMSSYPSMMNFVPPVQHSASSSTTTTTTTTTTMKPPSHSSKTTTKRPRLTAHLRSEILKLKRQKPTAFAWEIQQNLLQQGICTSQTLPSTNVIQRVLNESSKSNLHQPVMSNVMKTTSPMTICLSPSPSPDLSAEGETMSECSICLESYRSGQEVSILACSHEYHSSCIGEWMLKNRSCPMCRKDIHNQPQFVTLLI